MGYVIIFSNKVLGEMIDLQSNRSYQMLNNFNLYYGLNNLIRIKLKDKTSFHFMLFSGMFKRTKQRKLTNIKSDFFKHGKQLNDFLLTICSIPCSQNQYTNTDTQLFIFL